MATPFQVLGRDSASATAKCLKRDGASPRRKRQVTKPPGKQRSDGVKWWGFTLKLVPPRYVWWLMIAPLSIRRCNHAIATIPQLCLFGEKKILCLFHSNTYPLHRPFWWYPNIFYKPKWNGSYIFTSLANELGNHLARVLQVQPRLSVQCHDGTK